jgi:hypothetical protein
LQTESEIAESRSVREHQNRFYALAQKLLNAKSVTIVKRVLLAPLSTVHLRHAKPNAANPGIGTCRLVLHVYRLLGFAQSSDKPMLELYILILLCLNTKYWIYQNLKSQERINGTWCQAAIRKVWRKNTQMLFVAAKIDLNLNPQNRLIDLIAKSAAQKEIAGGKFAVHLGNRIQHVEILNEKDRMRVKPKC